MSEKQTLYVRHHDDSWPPQHPCRVAQRALRDAGQDFEKVIYDKGKPFGLLTSGTRPELKEMSGQEKLPVLKLPDGSTVNGGSNIAAWAKAHTLAPAAEASA